MCVIVFCAISGTIVLAGSALLLRTFGVDAPVAWGVGAGCAVLALRYMLRPDPRRRYIDEHGERLMAWLLPGWAHDMGSYYLVMVIFTFDKSISDLPGFLRAVMDRMTRLAADGRPNNPGEADVIRWIRRVTSYDLYNSREQVPPSLTDGRVVYCNKTYANKKLLPGGRLTLPYIYVAAAADVPDMRAPMVEYPPEQSAPDNRGPSSDAGGSIRSRETTQR